MLDLTTEAGKHADQRLHSDLIAWLTTVSEKGYPYSVPVWFLWDGQTVLLFSQPGKQKLRNLSKNPHVTLTLDNTKGWSDVVIVEGTAQLLADPAIKATLSAYAQKYGKLMQSMGWTPERMAADYSQGIRVTPTKVRTWS